MIKKVIYVVLNAFFAALLIYALYIFLMQKNDFDAQKIVQNSALKGKTFEANVEEITLDGGNKAWLLAENSAPLVALEFCFDKSGFAFDDDTTQGLAQMAAEILSYGGGRYENTRLNDLLEENAIELDFKVSSDAFFVSMTTPKNNIKLAFDILKDVLFLPHLKPEHLEIVRRKQLTAIDMQNEKPEKVLNKEFKKVFYGSHPLSRSALGLKEDVEKIDIADLKNFYQTRFVGDNLIIAVAGDVTKDEAAHLLNGLFSDLPSSSESKNLLEPDANYQFEEYNINRDMPQVLAHFVAKGVKRLDDDFYALYIANEIFGGSGLSSRLNLIAREKEGLTYGAYTYLNDNKYAPMIEGSFATSKENYQKMRQILLEEWQKMADFGVTKSEFEAVQNNMLTSFNLRFMSLPDIASQLLYMQKKHLGLDFLKKRNEYVKNTTLNQVNAAAKKYFAIKPAVLTIGNN